ncbi:hypothetical protein DFJ73DRAFT_858720 [Zopfochytrium polystomum]|nr:hypothetical protein DFJ73DRAFT_878239 [Zopfochytrium polystomum]KAI9330499.1 hypothetical protein DFJ73DRAFT_858720 [Zopfochytrium polystomum]
MILNTHDPQNPVSILNGHDVDTSSSSHTHATPSSSIFIPHAETTLNATAASKYKYDGTACSQSRNVSAAAGTSIVAGFGSAAVASSVSYGVSYRARVAAIAARTAMLNAAWAPMSACSFSSTISSSSLVISHTRRLAAAMAVPKKPTKCTAAPAHTGRSPALQAASPNTTRRPAAATANFTVISPAVAHMPASAIRVAKYEPPARTTARRKRAAESAASSFTTTRSEAGQ